MAAWYEDLKRIVRLRIDGQAVPPEMVRRLLVGVVDDFRCSTDDHGVEWNPRIWRDVFAGRSGDEAQLDSLAGRLKAVSGDRKLITRDDVFASSDPHGLLLAVMAWGYGLTGYGPHRTLRILTRNSNVAIVRAVGQLRMCATHDDIWRAFSSRGSAKLAGLGASFASKTAYFACYDRSKGTGPLIADWRSAWGFWAIDGSWAHGSWDIRKTADLYARYVDMAAMWAHDLGKRSDDVERALFVIGPCTKSAWKLERSP
jgi:hypothetical protein